MSDAHKGRRREWKVRDELKGHGWHLVARSAGSKGAADLVMVHPFHGLALLQVGTANKTLGPADRTRLLELAGMCGALPLVCHVIAQPGKPTTLSYWRVYDSPPSNWEPWDPA